MKEFIAKLVEKRSLTVEESAEAMRLIMEGKATDAQIAAFITALRMKGETVDEITGCARIMREKATPVRVGEAVVLDTCGTGGDAKGTFNVSTAAALVAAGAGLRVAKHGNRSVTSYSGSADVLEALGVKIDAEVAVVERCIAEAGVGFLFAPRLHGAMKHAIGPRREIGIRTVFNLLGPLTNPAGARHQLLGVYARPLTSVLADVLRNLGSRHCLVVHGADGMDELSITGETFVAELKDGAVKDSVVQPEDVGLRRASLADLVVKSAAESAAAIREVLEGRPGPKRDIVLLNAAAAIVAGDLTPDLPAALSLAAKAVDGGAAKRALQTLVEVSQRPPGGL